MKTLTRAKHIIGIDAMRFLAALMVVFFHFGYLLAVAQHSRQSLASQHLVSFPETSGYTYFGFVGVEIFFVISGFVIAFSGEKSSAFQFIASRIVRLGPGVWICSTLTLIATLVLGFDRHSEMMMYFRSIFFIPAGGDYIDGSYWTLGIELAFYSVVLLAIALGSFALIRPIAIAIGLGSSLFVIAGVVNLPVISAAVHYINKWPRIAELTLMHHGMFFAVGIFLWFELLKSPRLSNFIWLTFFIVSGCLEIFCHTKTMEAVVGIIPALVSISIWLASIAAVVVSVKFNNTIHALPAWILNLIRTAGAMSYPLYLLHQTVGNALMGWMILAGASRWTALTMALALILIATWFIAVYAEPILQRGTKTVLYSIRNWWLRISHGEIKPNLSDPATIATKSSTP